MNAHDEVFPADTMIELGHLVDQAQARGAYGTVALARSVIRATFHGYNSPSEAADALKQLRAFLAGERVGA